MAKVQRGAIELSVSEAGDPAGPPVLLVHGYPDTHDVWSEVIPRLVAAGLRVITYDVRGAGASTRPAGDDAYTLDELADDAAAVIDAVSPGRPVHVVGHDWGSIQSWELVTTARATGRVASFTSISGPCLDHIGHWLPGAGLRARASQAPRSLYVAGFHLPRVTAFVWRRLAPRWPAVRSLFERADAGPAQPTLLADALAGTALYRANVRPRLRAPRQRPATVPVQLVVPLRDRFVSRAMAVEATRPWAPSLRIRELDAGHWCVRTTPEPIARSIADHVREQGGARPRDMLAV